MSGPMHTPGPWDVVRDHPDPATSQLLIKIRPADHEQEDLYAFREEIACVFVAPPGSQREADALLMAAAPEMLEALRCVESFFADQKAGRRKGYDVLALNAVRVALAKAAGQEAGQ